jgi:Na+/H+-dicarboxylate symporter
MRSIVKLTVNIIKSPFFIFVGLGLGLYIGVYHQQFGQSMAPYGKLYISTLQMSIIPLVVTSISSSIANLFQDSRGKDYIMGMAAIFIPFLIYTSAIGIIAALILQPGFEVQGSMEVIKILRKYGLTVSPEIGMDDFIEPSNARGLMSFFFDAIPNNIFSAFADGKMIQLILVSIIFGVTLGSLKTVAKGHLLQFILAVQEIFTKIISVVIRALPLGVFFLVSSQLAGTSVDAFLAMLNYVIILCAVIVALLLVFSIIIWRRSGFSYFNSLSAMKYPVFLALVMSSSFAAMPAAMEVLTDKFKFERTATNLLMPLGMIIFRYGTILTFSFAIIFVAQLYNIPLTMQGYMIVLVGSAIAGVTTTGAASISALSMMSIVFEPLGLPFGAALVLFVAVDPIIDPFRSLLTMYMNVGVTSLVVNREK